MPASWLLNGSMSWRRKFCWKPKILARNLSVKKGYLMMKSRMNFALWGNSLTANFVPSAVSLSSFDLSFRGLRGYCYQKLGRDKEALGVYTAILKVKPSDVGVLAVVSNNIVVLNRDQNVFDSKKRIKAMKVDNIGYKLTAAQKLTIQLNQGLFYMLTNQVSSLFRNHHSTKFLRCCKCLFLLGFLIAGWTVSGALHPAIGGRRKGFRWYLLPGRMS